MYRKIPYVPAERQVIGSSRFLGLSTIPTYNTLSPRMNFSAMSRNIRTDA